GKFSLDDAPPADLQDGQVSLDSLAPGKHTLKIMGPREQAAVAFEIAAGAPPTIASVEAKEALAVTLASSGDHVHIQSSSGSAKVSIDGNASGETGANGLDITGLQPGNHELALGEGKDRRSMVLNLAAAPALTTFLKSDRNIGALLIVTGEDGVKVFLN